VYFAPPLKGFPLELGIGCRLWGGGQKLERWGYRANKKFDDLQTCGYNPPTCWTDGQTPDDSKTVLTHSVTR